MKKYKHNDLFKPGRLNAAVGENGGTYDFKDYAIGYFDAGKRVTKSLFDNESKIDVVIYPLVFIYRHAIELSLKHFIYRIPPILGKSEEVKHSHNLEMNWKVVKDSFIKLAKKYPTYFGTEKEFILILNEVDRIIKDFMKIDYDGQAFRYPENRKKEQHLSNISIIGVELFSDAMNKMSGFFQTSFEFIEHLLDDLYDVYEMSKEEMEELSNISFSDYLKYS